MIVIHYIYKYVTFNHKINLYRLLHCMTDFQAVGSRRSEKYTLFLIREIVFSNLHLQMYSIVSFAIPYATSFILCLVGVYHTYIPILLLSSNMKSVRYMHAGCTSDMKFVCRIRLNNQEQYLCTFLGIWSSSSQLEVNGI